MLNNFGISSSRGGAESPFLQEDSQNASKPSSGDEDSGIFEWVPVDTSIGLILAFSSCFFIGISVIYKKLALKDLQAHGGTRAVDGGYGYLRIKKWWFGITLMGLGELTNFVAYIFAPAILVTPLGVFSIVCTAALSPYFLKERLNLIGKLGCLLVLVGCIMVTLCGPKDREVGTMKELQSQLLHPGFLIYSAIVVGTSLILMALVPKFGHKYVMLYITICSSFGSLSVMFCKGVGLALKNTYMGTNEFTKWPTWVCLLCLIACLLIETIYMQKALDLFNSSVFMSVNYVMFTSLVIVASSILYTELKELGWKNIILTILGFIVNIVALYMLHLDKEEKPTVSRNEDISAVNSPGQDPETPLMLKINNNDKILKENNNSRNSPLSNIGLSPSFLRDNNKGKNIFTFMKKENSTSDVVAEGMMEHTSIYDSSSSESKEGCSLSSKSDGSNLESEEDIPNIEQEFTIGPCCLREVPLITELHSSSSRLIGYNLPREGSESNLLNIRPLSNVANDGLSDVDEVTQLVKA